jgi:hypothetical protein
LGPLFLGLRLELGRAILLNADRPLQSRSSRQRLSPLFNLFCLWLFKSKYLYPAAIAFQGDRSVLVGSKDRHLPLLKILDHFGRGMTKIIFPY